VGGYVMIVKQIITNGWVSLFFFEEKKGESYNVLRMIRGLNANKNTLSRARSLIDSDRLNVGFTYTNPTCKMSIVFIGETSSPQQLNNTLSHEIYHLVSNIANEDSLNEEETAIMSGDILMNLSDVICLYNC
jgi:hypothetical protein